MDDLSVQSTITITTPQIVYLKHQIKLKIPKLNKQTKDYNNFDFYSEHRTLLLDTTLTVK